MIKIPTERFVCQFFHLHPNAEPECSCLCHRWQVDMMSEAWRLKMKLKVPPHFPQAE